MNVLVTGGAGYIGSHACKALARAGHTPVTVDNFVYGHDWAVQWGPVYQADIQNKDLLVKILREAKIEAVLHFAAFAYVGESVQAPLKYYNNNVVGSLSLLSAMEESGVQKIVFSSTCATYGMPEKIPIDESSPQVPVNPYGASKLMVERILKDVTLTGNLSAVCLRYFNASGADPDLEIGEDHNPETHLIPLALQATFDASRPLTIMGADYSTPDGTCIRDYIHVTDLAEAHVKALLYLDQSPEKFSFFNLGSGRGFSVKEVVLSIEKTLGRKVNSVPGARRPGDPPQLVASGDKAKKILNWNPRHSDLSTIIETAAGWHEKHFLRRRR